MTGKDKYGILTLLEKALEDPYIYDSLASNPSLVVTSIWEEVYAGLELCETEDTSPANVIEILRRLCGGNIGIEESCGLFSMIKLTLPNNVCYLHKNQGSYYILPMYRSVIRLKTKIKADVAADVIMEFDRHAPTILKRIEDRITERKQEKILIDIVRATAYGMLETLKREERITLPESVKRVDILVSKDGRILANFVSPPHCRSIKCKLENFKDRLLKRFGTDQTRTEDGTA
jgi:hypothetical protein